MSIAISCTGNTLSIKDELYRYSSNFVYLLTSRALGLKANLGKVSFQAFLLSVSFSSGEIEEKIFQLSSGWFIIYIVNNILAFFGLL